MAQMQQIPSYKFYKHKYGTELLVDVLDLEYVKGGIRRTPVHRETYYCIILVTGGHEAVTIDGRNHLMDLDSIPFTPQCPCIETIP